MKAHRKDPAAPGNVAFHEALDSLHRDTGRMEASFASMRVATLDPSKPVIDGIVLSQFGLPLPYWRAPDRRGKVIRLYERLCDA